MWCLNRLLLILTVLLFPSSAFAQIIPQDALRSVVSVLPVWPNRPQGGGNTRNKNAPEGSGIVIGPDGLIATAWHVVEPAMRIDVRLSDGRILSAEQVAHDVDSDIALLRVDANLPPFSFAPQPALSSGVCAISNAFGLDLSVTCGVVSAVGVANAGFNSVEDFIQTDAAANPGSSGGALVNGRGELVGMLSAIFASGADTNAGINFAVSARLLNRVVDDLLDDGRVDYIQADWQIAPLRGQTAAQIAGVLVFDVVSGGVADDAKIAVGDVITSLNGRAIRKVEDIGSELAVLQNGDTAEVLIIRKNQTISARLSFGDGDDSRSVRKNNLPSSVSVDPDCPYTKAVCTTRQAVFPIESFDPIASAVRIASDLVVTNRHVIGDRKTANIMTPNGPLEAQVVASSYRGDLTLLRVSGLPADGVVLKPADGQRGDFEDGTYFAVGADAGQREIRVFEPGQAILPLAQDAPFARLHVSSRMQPGVSGGALVNEQGKLTGIAVGGGAGRYEALSLSQVDRLLDGTEDGNAETTQNTLGQFFVLCAAAIDAARETPRGRAYDPSTVSALSDTCLNGENPGQMIEAGRVLSAGRAIDEAIVLHEAAVARTPNSINARLSLLVSLQLGGRYSEMLPHARWVFEALDDDPQALRFAIQSGVWGDDKELAERAYAKLLEADPRGAQAARRFIDNAPPAPPRR